MQEENSPLSRYTRPSRHKAVPLPASGTAGTQNYVFVPIPSETDESRAFERDYHAKR